MRILFLPIVLCILSQPLKADERVFNSGEQQVPLLELYTSEGCSSCPPADRWLSRLKETNALWSKFVPVAFHVGYWDYIGWEDRFAKQEYTQRQRRYATEFGETTVYTPGVRLAGSEWRSWRRAGLTIPQPPKGSTPGNLSLTITEGGHFQASFKANLVNDLELGDESAQLTVALLGQALTTEVKRGENRGRTLTHDFVVLANTTLSGQNGADGFAWEGRLPTPNIKAEDYAVAAWVSTGGKQYPIQALGGPLSARLLPGNL